MARLSMYLVSLAGLFCIAALLGASDVSAQPSASSTRLQCTNCRYTTDLPCKDEAQGEKGVCCMGIQLRKSGATGDCYARDSRHSCEDTYKDTGAINAHCCSSCT